MLHGYCRLCPQNERYRRGRHRDHEPLCSQNGGGSASEGVNAYEILKEENTPATAKNSQLLAVFGVALVILIIALGYRSKNKDDYQLDNHDYEL